MRRRAARDKWIVFLENGNLKLEGLTSGGLAPWLRKDTAERAAVQIWSATSHRLVTNHTSISISGGSRTMSVAHQLLATARAVIGPS